MPKAIPIPTTNRRGLLAGATAALLAGAAIATATDAHGEPPVLAPSPDAELIALVETLKRQHAEMLAIEAEGATMPPGATAASEDQERRLDLAMDQHAATTDAIIATPARTVPGMQAKAEALGIVVLFYAYTEAGDTLETVAAQGDTSDRIALSLARDVRAWR